MMSIKPEDTNWAPARGCICSGILVMSMCPGNHESAGKRYSGRRRKGSLYPCVQWYKEDIDLAAYGGNINGHMSIGDLPTATGCLNGVGILQLDAKGQADVRATTGNCTVTIWTYGYVM